MTRAPFLSPPPLPLPAPHGPELFGTLTVEVLTPDGQVTVPGLADWELRAWPVARLGDATLEARPRHPHLGAAALDSDLRRAGYTPLGPFHPARGRAG
ncbi:hypothetical protein DEIPH_ctg044orf0060 [Deinococcus phoenicis]|uniref:Uncharacterized protein n=1 Tax=Deinococcus phoenicis TaxID=1476583 RepID=A0A016QN65_9DEIO|nr:hypothetical protein [Deinococcus phoenicis]EYB67337.1 hypothetical protein DEIPH_ctg044orf0060 [Deinococcus phoenicis]